MLHILVLVGTVVCAIQAIRAKRLIVSALWLAGTSALVALEMYLLGAPEIGVIELSVGAGLVTVLFVFAINLTGEEALDARDLIKRPLAWGLLFGMAAFLVYFLLPEIDRAVPSFTSKDFYVVMWEDRQADLHLQILLIFCGVLGVLGLLTENMQSKHSQPGGENYE
jgi:NADH:ubiquinone oxidoreductase subunit 6 (subunit J)